MIYFLLALLVCANGRYSDCHWTRAGRFVSEENCLKAGGNFQLRDEQVIRYKCVIQAEEKPR